jgi:hypothetical protein
MAEPTAAIKARWAARRQELLGSGYKKIDGKWRKIGLAPTSGYKSRASKTGGAEAPTEFQRKVRAEKRKAFRAAGYEKQGKEWVRTVKGFK